MKKDNENEDKNLRVEKHLIKPNNELYNQLDNYCFLSKNLYNFANYHLRQVFIITSKLSEGKEVTQEQTEYLKFINIKVDEFNELKVKNYEKAKIRAIKNNKEFKKKLKQCQLPTTLKGSGL